MTIGLARLQTLHAVFVALAGRVVACLRAAPPWYARHMRRGTLILWLAACGPTVGTGDEGGGDSSSAGAAETTAADSGDGVEATTAMASVDTGVDASGSSTGEPLEDLPPEATGGWLCSGWGDALYVTLVTDAEMIWSGSLCAPEISSGGDPTMWTNCSELHVHGEVLPSQSYWAGELPYPESEMPVPFEVQLDYAPADDSLGGFFFPGSPPVVSQLSCARWLPD